MISWFEDMEVTSRLKVAFPFSLDAEREWLRRAAEDKNRILWVIEHEGRPVGTTSIHGIDWANQHGSTGTAIGDKTAWGKGIARTLSGADSLPVFPEELGDGRWLDSIVTELLREDWERVRAAQRSGPTGTPT